VKRCIPNATAQKLFVFVKTRSRDGAPVGVEWRLRVSGVAHLRILASSHESVIPSGRDRRFDRLVCSNGDAICLKKMHELSIAVGLIDLAAEEAARQGNVRVATVYLRIGPLAGVVADALRFSFDLAAEGTAVEGARLEIEDVPVTVRCARCAADNTVGDPQRIRCPICGGPATVVGGRELELAAMEVIDVATDR
jgi:hydrogenase nickel incorporation protein HypA/HybF